MLLFCSWSTLVLSQVQEIPKVKLLSAEFIYEKAPFDQCHASTLVALENGSVMVAWFGGTHERHPDVSVYMSINESDSWSLPKMIADGVVNDTVRYPCWNPVLFRNSNDQVFLYYKVGPSPSSWWGMYKMANGNGKNWSEPIRLPQGILGPIKNKPIQVNDNLIVSPSSTESENGLIWKAHVEISKDGGYTWSKVEIPSDKNEKVIQPTLIKLPNGNLKALLRSDQDFVMQSISADQGSTWSKVSLGTVPNPNSGIDAVELKKGGYLLVYNPTAGGEDWSDGRQKLNLAYSADGNSWTDILKLEDHGEGEYSYPSIIQDSNGLVHISYTYNRAKIKYVRIKLN